MIFSQLNKQKFVEPRIYKEIYPILKMSFKPITKTVMEYEIHFRPNLSTRRISYGRRTKQSKVIHIYLEIPIFTWKCALHRIWQTNTK